MSARSELFPYQVEGAQFLADREHAALFDPMGLGKTPQGIRALDLIGAKRAIVVAPAVAGVNWCRELERWQRIDRPVHLVKDMKAPLPREGVVVTSYDKLARRGSPLLNNLISQDWDALICDEAHFLKNPEANRTNAIYGPKCTGTGLVAHCAHTYVLTGTPAPNNPGELWPHLRALFEEYGFNASYWQFVDHYCRTIETAYGTKIIGARKDKLEDLAKRMRKFAIRRERKKVLPDMPPVTIAQVHLEPKQAGAALDALKDLEADGALSQIRHEIEAVLDDAQDDSGGIAASLDQGMVSSVRRYTGLAKVAAVAELVENDLGCGLDKIVIFAVHRDVIAQLEKSLGKFGVVSVHGGTSPDARQRNVDRFQTDPDCRVFIGQIQAAGTAIDLTAARSLLFAEIDWVPANNAQALYRVHRITQKRNVLVRLATLAGSIDELVTQVVMRKVEMLQPLFGES